MTATLCLLCLHCSHGYGQHDPETGRCFAHGRRAASPCPCQGFEPGDLPDRRPDLL
jgi:hypothetical protein